MKFNAIEISGFRIYDNPEDATFNFLTEKGITADFVSLFAPNGFGKTSFYDAVEWGMTNNVARFWVNKSITEKSINTLRGLTSKHIQLLRNNNTTNKTFVKITDHNNIVKDRILNIASQRKTDINKDSEEIDNRDFLNVILSQEWISAFLKEADGKTRYKKFMDNNSKLQEIDIYYQSVITLYKANEKNIIQLKKDIEKLESQIIPTEDKDLLKTVNEQIELLQNLLPKQVFTKVNTNTSKEDIKNLNDKLTELLTDEKELKTTKKGIEDIVTAKAGNDNLYSKTQYFNAKEELKKVQDSIKEIEKSLESFEKLNAVKNELVQKTKQKENITEELEKLQKIKQLLPEYNDINKQVSEKKASQKEKKEILKKLEKEVEISKRKLIEDDEKNKNIERQKLQLQKQIDEIPKLQEQIKNLEKEVQELTEKVKLQKKDSLTANTNYNKLVLKIEELTKVQNEFKNGQYSETSLNEDNTLISHLKKIETLDTSILKLKKELSELQKTINAQESLDTSLKEFIASGLAIVTKTETENCPLCEHTYENYTVLADKIANNNALSNAVKLLLKDRTKLEQAIETSNNTRNTHIEILTNYYNNQQEKFQKDLKLAKENQEETQQILNKLNKELTENQEKIIALKANLDSDSIEKFKEKLESQLSILNDTKKSTEQQLSKTKIDNEKLLKEQSQLESIIKLLQEEINKLLENSSYVIAAKWYSENIDDVEYIDDLVVKKIKEKLEDSKNIAKAIVLLKEKQNEFNNVLKEFNDTQLKEEKEKKDIKSQTLASKLKKYELFISDNLAIELATIDSKSMDDKLKSIDENLKTKLKQLAQLGIELNKLKGFTENIIPFLQSEKAKSDLTEMTKELSFVEETAGKLLNDEIERTRDYLDKQIQDFFYEKLINEIYSKIDPHPKFKNVKFKATFSDTSPSLDVFVKNDETDSDTDSLIPNLYFSTAQVNILSLSIFLASALNSKSYDCIFIDDPIQSMDSINVLSTIDLFRSIVVNNKKQIILSTHDENFHNLLKMKMPKTLFKSKFLELESFGKLKK